MAGRIVECRRVHLREPGLEVGDDPPEVGLRQGLEAVDLLLNNLFGLRLRQRTLDLDDTAGTGILGILRALQVAHLRVGDRNAGMRAHVLLGALPPLVGEFRPVRPQPVERRPLEDHRLAARLEEVESELTRLPPEGARRRVVEHLPRKIRPSARRMAVDDLPEARGDAPHVQSREVGVNGLDHRVRHGVQDEVHVRVRTDDARVEVLAHEVEDGALDPLAGDLAGPAGHLAVRRLRPGLADLREEVDVVPPQEPDPGLLVFPTDAGVGAVKRIVAPHPLVVVAHEGDGRGRVRAVVEPDDPVVVVDELVRHDVGAVRPRSGPVDDPEGLDADVGEAVVRELAAGGLTDVPGLRAHRPRDVVAKARRGDRLGETRRQGREAGLRMERHEFLDSVTHSRLARTLEEVEERGRGEADGHAAVAREGHAEGVLADPDRGVLERRRHPGGGRERIKGDGLRVLERGVDSRGHGFFSFFLA